VAWRRSNCAIALPVVVLPLPDSPTSASVRPRASCRLMPSTAAVPDCERHQNPLARENVTRNCSTASKGTGVAPDVRRASGGVIGRPVDGVIDGAGDLPCAA